ncbi:MAG TPA: PadR family transcriptional regulator [Acidimicrobiales bacterium]
MPIHHAVLSLLAEGPSHGYELKARFEEAVGPQWGPLNIGHLYQILGRLDRDQMVRSRRAPQPARPDRVVYEITAAGRAELDAWLAQPAERPGGFRDDLFLKILAADRSPDDRALPGVLTAQRTYLLHELRDLAELRRTRGAPGDHAVVRLLITAAELQLRAQVQFLDVVEDELVAGRAGRRRDQAGSWPSGETGFWSGGGGSGSTERWVGPANGPSE